VVGYHAVNVAVHVLAALVLYGIVVRTLRLGRLGARAAGAAPHVALAVALLWAVHPLQTESVTYVVQRAESLMGLCCLLTIYAVVRAAAAPHQAMGWSIAAVGACAVGMLCKPVMAIAPLAVLVFDRAFLAGSWANLRRTRGALHLGLGATLLVLVVLLAGGAHESAATAGFAIRDVSALEYARSQPGVILRYLRLAFWPLGLVLDYAWPVAGAGAAAFATMVLAALVVLTLRLIGPRSPLAALVALFFLLLAPSSSLVPIKDLAFEHRMYLPLAPLVALAVAGGWASLERARLGAAAERRAAVAVTAALVGALGALTVARNHDYRSAVAMWTDVTGKRPDNARAYSNLAQAFLQEHKVDAAVAAGETAVRLDPGLVEAHVNLGDAYGRRREFARAEAEYAAALRLRPQYPVTHNNLGVALVDQQRYGEAEPHYREALRLKPDYAEAHNNLGIVLMRQGRLADAVASYGEALRLKPDYTEVYNNRAGVLVRQGKYAEAEQEYRRALRLAPEYAEVHFNLAIALEAEGKRDDAVAHAAEAFRLRPDLEPVIRKSGLLPGR
jgi:protein O-mannosyl-transferase